MRKKLTLFFALLCASMMSWAVDQDTWIGGNDNYANQFKWYAIDGTTAPMAVANIEKKDGQDVIFVNVGQADFDRENGIIGCEAFTDAGAGVWIKISSLTLMYNEIYFKHTNGTVLRALKIYNALGINETGKTTAELSITSSTTLTLDATINETSQITWTSNNGNTPTFTSSNPNVVTVSETGLLTAIGRGTAIITVEQAETSEYLADSKKIDVAVNGPIVWNNVDWLVNGVEKYKLVIEPAIEDRFGGKKIDGENLYVAFPSAAFGTMSIEPSGGDGAWRTFALSNFPKRENKFTVVCEGTTYTFTVYYADGTEGEGGSDPDPDPDPDPTPTGICASGIYTSNVAGYDIHAQVTKGVNKYYLTLTSATDGKTLTGLNGVNMHCYQYGNESRSEDQRSNYHMAVAGRYTIADGAITFTIPSVGDPQMFTTLNVRFNDNTICEISGLQGVRLVPCSTEDPVPYDPDPSEIEDTNFALSSNGAYAYASAVENQGKNAMVAIDGNNGSAFSTAHSDPQWFIVDLGQRRIFNTIQIRWEGAYATAFTIDVSNDGETWTNKVKETAYSKGGNNTEYEADLGSNVTARFVRFNGTARATQWGHSFYEFRVLLKGVPVLTSVDLVSDKKITKVGEYATLTASPKDQNSSAIAATLTYTVSPVDAGHVTDGKYYPEKYGLATITVTAEAGGKSLNNAVQIWGVVSDNLAYSSNIDTDNKVIDQSEITGDANNAFYAVNGSTAVPWWQACRDLEDNKSNANFTSYFTLDLGKKYAINLIVIWFDGAASDDYTIAFSEDNSTWQEGYHISQSVGNYTHQKYLGLTDLNNNDQARYVRFTTTKASTTSGWGVKIKEMEVYGAEVSSTKTVSATVTPEASGTVTITADDVPVTEVPSGTLVKFTASANDGYDFINWTQGGVEVSTSLEYSTTITSNTALVANFEAARTAYCAEPVTNAQSHTIYLTVKKTNNANEFMILLEGSSGTHITNVHDNIQFRLTHVNGSDEAHRFAQNEWSVDATGYGTAYATFTATDFRAITISNLYIPLVTSNSGADEFYFPTNDASLVKWDATCTDDEAPELADPVASPLSGTSVRLTLSATDNMAVLLTYNVNYKPTGDAGAGTDVPSFSGTAGETTTKDIQGLTAGVNYTFTVTVSDGTNTSEVKTCAATPSMPTAPVPTRNAAFVRSIYSNAYTSVITSNYGKNSYSGIPYQELNVGGDNFILYDYSTQKEIVWGADNENSDAILAATEYTDGVHKGLDVREMNYIHFDVYSTTATTYPNLYVQNTQFPYSVDGSGWQSFDIDISGLDPNVARSVTMLKFNDFRTPKPDEIAIDNVYFWSYGTRTTPVMGGDEATGGWATFASPVKVAVPSGLTAYKATYSNEGGDEQLVLDAVSGAIPANEGVLLRGEADHVYTFSPTNDDAGDYAGNALKGCPVRTDITSVAATNDIFCLRYSELYSLTGFFIYSGQYIAAGKAYLPLPKAEPSSAPRRIRFVFREEQGTTGFDPTNAEAVPTTKFIENGQLYIRRGNAVYTIQGVRVK